MKFAFGQFCGKFLTIKNSYSMLEWKSDYETGMPAIDAQHKVLFEHINRLGKFVKTGEIQRSEADYLLTFLENYAVQHFNGEEACMARFQCPAYERNKEDHALFLNVLRFCKTEYKTTDQPKETLERLHESMRWWINQHILKVDVRLKDSISAKQNMG